MKLKQVILIFFSFFLFQFSFAQCYYHLYMYDSYGDGWNGAYLEVTMNGVHVGDYECYQSFDLDSVYSFTGASMDFIFHSGNWDSEITFTILDPMGDTLVDGPAPSDLDNLLHTSNSTCPSTISCLNPIYLNASNLTSNSATLNWTPGSSDTIWNLHWDVSNLNSHPMYGNGTSVSSLVNNNYPITGLNPYTDYDFYVQAVCGANSNSVWSGPYTFTTSVIPGNCGIYNLELHDSYGDGWDVAYLEIILNGTIIDSNVTIQNGFGPEFKPIAVDSGDVIDILYYPGAWPEENSYILYDHSGNIIVSQTSLHNNGPPSTYGIVACTSCSSPQTLFADNITPYAVDLSWNPGGSGGLIWNLEWGNSGFIQGNGNLINNLNNSYHTLTSLNPSTDYSFYVQEVCSSNDQSSWSGPYNFTTNSLPPAPGTCGMFQIALYDTYGDGWQGGFAEIEVNYLLTQTITLQTGSGPEFFDIPVDSGDIVNVIYSPGAWEEENVYEVYDQNGLMIANEAGSNGQGPADTYGLNACLPSGAGGNSSPCGWFILEMFDSLADGWNGSYITVELNGIATHNLTMLAGTGTQLLPFMVDSNQVIDVLYHDNGASSQEENSYKLTDNLGNLLSHEYGSLNNGPANTHGVIACESNLTAINEINSNVSIYPNPANNSFKVKSKNKIQQLRIYNIIGESVLDVYPQQKEFWLDVSFLSSNLYTVKVITDNDQKIEKLLIHH